MTVDPTGASSGIGWAVAGAVLVVSGLALGRRDGGRAPGALLALAGATLVAVVLVPEQAVGARLGVAAMVLMVAAVAAYPRLGGELSTVLTISMALVGGPLLAWSRDGGDGLGTGDLAWVAAALAGVALAHLWWRLETTTSRTRGSLLWMVSAVGLVVFLTGVATLGGMPPALESVAHACVGIIGVAALLGMDQQGRLDGRWFASRVAAWCFCLACAFATATLVLTLFEWRTGTAPGIVTTTLAAVLCGVLWTPLLRVVRRVSDGVLFGWRPDVLSAAQRMAVGIGDDPAAAVRAVQQGLVLPYAALALNGEDVVEVGIPGDRRRIIPLDDGARHIGDLVVGIRPGDLDLTRDDERVLALSLPMLVQTIRLRRQADSLQQARQAGASAREEERRRLRRDLHDGLGPRLTGIAFTADAARLTAAAVLDTDTLPMLDRIRQEAETAITEVRELTHNLRPPALDELGLVGALSVKATAFHGLRVDLRAQDLPALEAAVEVAAYRIVMEAVTNVARHSGATNAVITLRDVEDTLLIDVHDDGTTTGEWVPGVGLTSMRERAGELGGDVTFTTTPRGSTVTARLPLTASQGAAPAPSPVRQVEVQGPEEPSVSTTMAAADSNAPADGALEAAPTIEPPSPR